VLCEYVNTFDFSKNSSIDNALRVFLGYFRLPGEAQCIDRLMEAFASRLFEFLGPKNPFNSRDAAFVLSFSTIMLNTDLHNPQVPDQKRMKKEEFIRNNRGINDGEDLPKEYLENLYDRIKEKQIQVDFDICDIAELVVDYSETSTWDALLRKCAADQAPAAFTPTLAARKWLQNSGSRLQPSVHDKDMFIVMAKPLLRTLFLVWEYNDEDKLIYKMLEGMLDYASACIDFELFDMLNLLLKLMINRVKASLFVSFFLFVLFAILDSFTVCINNKKIICLSFIKTEKVTVAQKNKNKTDGPMPIPIAEAEKIFGPEFQVIISTKRINSSR